jgi:hypothetical protein
MNDVYRKPQIAITTDKDDTAARLTELKEKFERGEIRCAALRIYNGDGTWEDVVLGGDSDEERAQVLEDLHRAFRSAH